MLRTDERVLFGMAGMRKEDAIALGLLWFAATMVGGSDGRDRVRDNARASAGVTPAPNIKTKMRASPCSKSCLT